MIRFMKAGRPPKEAQKLVNEMNDILDSLDATQKSQFDKGYETFEELKQAYDEMKKINVAPTPNSSSSGIEEAKIESTSKEEDKSSSSEPDEFDFNNFESDPNVGDTIKRSYSEDRIDHTLVEDIPEPTFSLTSSKSPEEAAASQEPQPQSQSTRPEAPKSEPKPEPQMANPALQDVDDKTKRIAAEQLVDTLLAGYDMLHQFAKPIAMVKDKKITELEKKGLVDPAETIAFKGEDVTLREVVDATNQAIDGALTPDPTFHAKVRPAMIREFTKKGYGITDGQKIVIEFAMDIAGKTAEIIGVRRNLNTMIDMLKESQKEKREYYAEMKRRATIVTPDSITTPSSSQTQAQPEPEMAYTETETV